MPYASITDLPPDVRGVLPELAQAHWLRVFTAAANAGEDDAKASALAWRGLTNAGWSKDADGTWRPPAGLQVTKRRDGNAVTMRLPVTKIDGADDSVEVSGWASVALDAQGRVVVDHQSDIIPVPVLEAAAKRFLIASREFNAVTHYDEPCGYLTESVVMTPATRIAMGLDGTGPTGWWVSARILGPAAKRVRAGELREFSIEATALKEPQPDGTTIFRDLHVDRVTLVDAGAGIGVRIEAVKARQESNAMNMEQILAKLSPEEQAYVLEQIKSASKPSDDMDMEAMKAQAEQAKAGEAAAKRRLAEIEAEAKLTPEQRDAAAMAALPEPVRKRLVDEKARSDKLEADLLAMREIETKRVYGEKVAKMRGVIGASTDDLIFALRAADSLTAKSADGKSAGEILTEALLRSSEAVAKTLVTVGSSKTPEEGSAQAQIEAKAKAIIAADETLRAMPVAKSMPIARTRVYDAHPELYQQTRGN